MAKGYNSYGIIGAPISPGVSQQLSRRRDIVSKRENRTAEDIAYLNSVTGWVKVTSAVDTLVEESDNEYSSDLASNFQLFGGTYSTTGARGGFVQKDDKTFSDNSSYNYSEVSGIVPMPGITSFVAQSQGTYGTLRAASFNITVHSPEDFNVIEQLFLRPGFTVLIEWGHSSFIDNDGDLTQPSYLDPDKFLRSSKESEIRKELLGIRGQKNSFNSDFMYGFIKNFAWSFNGINYECQVDVISKGEIISSIRSSFANFTEEQKEENEIAKRSASEIEYILNTLKQSRGASSFTNEVNIDELQNEVKNSFLGQLKPEEGKNELGEKYYDLFTDSTFLVADLLGNSGETEKDLTKYITLRDYLKLVNRAGFLKDQDGDNVVEFFTGPKQTEGAIDPSPYFNTFPEHIAIDPYICILPKSKENSKYSYGLTVNNINFNSEDPLNIYINVNLILEKYSSVATREKQDDNLLSVIRMLLSDLNKNLGSINELTLHYEEDESLYYITDRKTVPSLNDFEQGTDGKPKSFIDIVGLNSEILNLNVSSKLSGNLTSMIAIAAQPSKKGSIDSDILQVQRWNAGLRDRHLTEKSAGNTGDFAVDDDPTQPFEYNQKLFNKYESFIDNVNKHNSNVYIGFDRSHFRGISKVHREMSAQFVRFYAEKEKTNTPGMIPFELFFTVKGISGLKVGQAFLTNEFFLPSRYRGKVGFIITGLDHKVENNYWSTDVKSQIIIL